MLRGRYAYYGVAGNIRALFKVYRATERYWQRMLCSRSWAASRMTRDTLNQIKTRTPLLRPSDPTCGNGGGRPPPVTR